MIFLTRQKAKGQPSTYQLYHGGQLNPDGSYEQGTPIGGSFTSKSWSLGTRYLRMAAAGGTVPTAQADAAILGIAVAIDDMKRLKQKVRQL